MATNPQSFKLEVDDRSIEERRKDTERRNAKQKRNFVVSALENDRSEKDKGPMDSKYIEDLGEPEPMIRINLGFLNRLDAVPEQDEQESFRKRLFDAVSSRDITQLQETEEYLKRNGKLLSDSVYRLDGKTPLVKALLNLKKGENETVKYLLDIAKKMGDLKDFVNAALTDSYYAGQTALHIAIERRSKYFVELLVEKGADVHAKASGEFFQLRDGICFYFGELPFSLAACTNQREIVDFLLENQYQSLNVDETDSQGNMVLHALVVVADTSYKNTDNSNENTDNNTDFIIKMYDHILTKAAQLYPGVKLEEIKNNQGLTPIKLAAKTGKIKLLEHMMHREFQEQESIRFSRKFTEWAYGPVYASLYDLGSLDSFEENSVLEIVVYGSEIPNRLEMLQVEPLNRLLDEKWNGFAHRIFLFRFVMYCLYLCIFTSVSYLGNRKMSTATRVLFAAGQQISFWGAVYFFFRELLDIRRKRPNLQSFLIDGYFELIFFLQALLCIVSFVLHWCGRKEHVCFLVWSLVLSWMNLLYFCRGSSHMGIYSVMIQKILLGDILRFLLVYMVFLIGFSAAVVTLMDEPEDLNNTTSVSSNQTSHRPDSDSDESEKPTFKSFRFTTQELFKLTIGMGDLEFTEQVRYTEMFYVLLISYIVLTYILLLNMLIALMSSTVAGVSEESTNIWKLQRAITILDMERNLPMCLRKRLRCGVEKNIGGSAGDECRRCLRVEEMTWNKVGVEDKWNSDKDTICEDPGSHKSMKMSTPAPTPEKGKGWSLLRRVMGLTSRASNSERGQTILQSPGQA